MPYELNAREVLFYLNDLGYTNITAQQLKDFMIDLKKLVKYNDSNSPQPLESSPRDIFDDLYSTDTIASRAKSVKARSKGSVITVQINRPKLATGEPVCSRSAPASVRESDTVDLSVKAPSECSKSKELLSVPSFSADTQKCHTCSSARTIDTIPQEKKLKVHEKKCKMRPKTSFIRPRLNTRPPKSDPVALYHQYQEQWKKQKIPGTTNHPEVRWCIREKLMGDKFDYCY